MCFNIEKYSEPTAHPEQKKRMLIRLNIFSLRLAALGRSFRIFCGKYLLPCLTKS
jgi:hypothetical protein